MKAQVIQGNNVDILKQFPDNHFDSIVTDPPYGIDFLGKAWDATTGSLETYQECLRVLKPGGHIIAFSAARTYHHLAVTIEQAGFEIRDQIMWIYSSGFPKSQDIGRQIHKATQGRPDKQRFDQSEMQVYYRPGGGGSNGWSRVAFGESEPAKNAQTTLWRHKTTGRIYKALPDINGDRLAQSHEGKSYGVVYEEVIEVDNEWSGWGTQLKPAHEPCVLARKPLAARNIRENCEQWGVGALNIDATRIPYEDDKDIETYLDNKRGPMERSTIQAGTGIGMFEGQVGYKAIKREVDPEVDLPAGRFPSNVIGEIADYQKYFYCPKVSKAERHIGYDDATSVGNNHPTVKPIELMKYLIKLVTPAGGHILDPFCGSGSTGCAAVELDYEFTGCELDPHYVSTAQRRIQAWYEHTHNENWDSLFEWES